MFTHTVLSREVLEQDGCNLKLSAGALEPPRPANLCSAALHSARPWCVFFTLSLSPDFLGLLSHDCTPAPSDRGCQSAVRHSGGSSWINSLCTERGSLGQTHMHSISVPLVYIHRGGKLQENMAMKNRQGDIYYLIWTSLRHNLRQTVCSEWHQKLMKDPGWGYSSFWLPSSPADGPIHLCDALQELNSISSFSCSLFSPHSIPFPSLSLPPVHDTGSVPSKMLTLIPWRWSWGWFCRAPALAVSSAELWLAAESKQVAYLWEFANALGQRQTK